MTQALADKAAAERDRKARIRAAKERLEALPCEEQAEVGRNADAAETEARAAGDRTTKVAFLERALDEWDDAKSMVAAAIDGLGRDQVRADREAGMTLAELRLKYGLGAVDLDAILDGMPMGGDKTEEKVERAAARAPKDREVGQDDGGQRTEKCPTCGEHKPAPVDADGKYLKVADFRAGRRDCRTCYNTRWREGVERRKAARG